MCCFINLFENYRLCLHLYRTSSLSNRRGTPTDRLPPYNAGENARSRLQFVMSNFLYHTFNFCMPTPRFLLLNTMNPRTYVSIHQSSYSQICNVILLTSTVECTIALWPVIFVVFDMYGSKYVQWRPVRKPLSAHSYMGAFDAAIRTPSTRSQ